MPAGGAQRRDEIQHVVIEEPEMGLHPKAISAFLLVVLELLRRGYRVCISTHSPHVLDVIWALRVFQEYSAEPRDVRRIFSIKSGPFIDEVARTALGKSYKTYYFPSGDKAVDISDLDPGHESEEVRGWGGLTAFTANIGDVIAEVVSRSGRR
jgi:ABC-type multidrug transport system ATPase subunit